MFNITEVKKYYQDAIAMCIEYEKEHDGCEGCCHLRYVTNEYRYCVLQCMIDGCELDEDAILDVYKWALHRGVEANDD